MLDQTFSLIDIPRLMTLTFLEGILSVDNALALALIVHHLPSKQKKKALFVGLFSAIILRAIGVLSAAFFIHLFWIQMLGGAYLLYLSLSHLIWMRKARGRPKTEKQFLFWKVVILVELTDFAFAIDSILAGVALIGVHFTPPHLPPKMWIVYFGGITGIIMMRFAAGVLTRLIDRFPGLAIGAHLIVGWIGIKLLIEAFLKFTYKAAFTSLPDWVLLIFWMGIVTFFTFSFFVKKKENN